MSVSSQTGFSAWFSCFSGCGPRHPLDASFYRCPQCQGLLEVTHDVDALTSRDPSEWKAVFRSRRGGLSGVWSKKEMVLPELDERDIVSLGEGNSPLIPSQRMAALLGVASVSLKQCGTSHTGSFKDLGMTVLVSMVHSIRDRIRAVACASTGDTSAALAAYAAAAGIRAVVILPRDKISLAQLIQPISNGALTLSLDTDFDGCMRIVQEITSADPSIYLANSMNPLRVEGQKTIALEILEQMDWKAPDFVVVPGGNLGNIAAIGAGFLLARDLGLTRVVPRLVCAQSALANPLYRAYLTGFERFEPVTAGETLATAIRIGNPVSFPKAVEILRTTNGIVGEATEAELADAAALGDRFGFFNDPQTGVALAVTRKLIASGEIPPSSRVVVISTAHGLKFPDFKLSYHRGQLEGTSSELRNLPLEIEADTDQVRRALDVHLGPPVPR
jgi:threonine synthase